MNLILKNCVTWITKFEIPLYNLYILTIAQAHFLGREKPPSILGLARLSSRLKAKILSRQAHHYRQASGVSTVAEPRGCCW